MNKYALLAIGSAIMVFVSTGMVTAAAEDSLPNVPLSLIAATEMAIKARPALSLESERAKLALSRVKQARGNFLPTLDFLASNSYVKSYDDFTGIDISARFTDQDISVTIDKNVPSYQLNDELSLAFNLYAGGRDRALLGEAVDNLQAARHQEGAMERKVRLEVARAYWGLKKAHIRYAMAKRELEVVRMEMLVAATEQRVDRRSEVEYDAVVLKGREKEVALKTIDRDCLRAFDHYLHVVGMEEKDFPPTSEQIPLLIDEPGGETNSAGGMADHPDILRLGSEVQAASQRVEAAKAENLPKLDFFARHSLIGRDSNSLWDAWGDSQSDTSTIGLKMSMNLFNGFRTEERINQAEAEVRMKRLQLVQKKRDLLEEENVRIAALEAAKDQLSLAIARKMLEETREKAAESQLQSGRISQLEYRQKVVNVENATNQVLIAKIDVILDCNALELLVLSQQFPLYPEPQ